MPSVLMVPVTLIVCPLMATLVSVSCPCGLRVPVNDPALPAGKHVFVEPTEVTPKLAVTWRLASVCIGPPNVKMLVPAFRESAMKL